MAGSAYAAAPLRAGQRGGTAARHWFGGVLLLACALASPSGAAAQGPALSEVSDPVGFLQKVQAAARKVDYAGVFTYQQGASMQSSRVTHMLDGTGERERLEVLDGSPREFIRHNNTVHCLLPDKKLVIIEQRRIDRFPGLLLGQGDSVAQHYTLSTSAQPQRVAGRECRLVEVTPRDSRRYGYRFCVDTQTNLLIKAQTLDSRGAVIDQIAFTSLQLAEDVNAEQLKTRWDTQGWKVLEVPTHAIDVAGQGWRITPPPGFAYTTQISRPMKSGKPVTQMVLTDGLAVISVFIEPFQPAKNAKLLPKGAVRNGAMNIYGTRIGDHWLTAIGEVPADTLRELAERTEYVPPAAAQ